MGLTAHTISFPRLVHVLHVVMQDLDYGLAPMNEKKESRPMAQTPPIALRPPPPLPLTWSTFCAYPSSTRCARLRAV